MSSERKKKDGENKEKKVRRSKEAQEARHREAQEVDAGNDQGDIIQFKPGSANDQTHAPGGMTSVGSRQGAGQGTK